MLVRGLLVIAGAVAGLLVARDVPTIGVLHGMLALVVACAGIAGIALLERR